MLERNYLKIIVHLYIVVLHGLIIKEQLTSIRRLTVAFNNIHRGMLGLPWRCSASAMYENYDLPNIDTVVRRSLFRFIQRLSVSQNSIVRSIEQSWFVRIKLWDFWTKILYL